mmetsp:Transcript_17964/g.24853  ORF Transcript_17964/g.24853 Transcript_17964/m.24853 type:complete len:223 (-) Transcript_17964:303-971(-)
MDDMEGFFGTSEETNVPTTNEDHFSGDSEMPSFDVNGDDGELDFAVSNDAEVSALPTASEDDDNMFREDCNTTEQISTNFFSGGGEQMDSEFFSGGELASETLEVETKNKDSGKPSPLEVWSAQQYERLNAEAEEEQRIKKELVSKAEKEREEIYAKRTRQIQAKMQTNRENVDLEYESGSGELWEQVYNLIDPSPKVAEGRTDLTRMRQVLAKIKHHPIVV